MMTNPQAQPSRDGSGKASSKPSQAGGSNRASNTPRSKRNRGFGMIIITAYGIFAVSSFARALYQIVTDFNASPVAYSLSALAAAVYALATIALATSGARAWKVAFTAVIIELIGVLGVGLWTYLDPELFNEATVWSHFGEGYGFVPLVLPVIGLFWLLRHRETSADDVVDGSGASVTGVDAESADRDRR